MTFAAPFASLPERRQITMALALILGWAGYMLISFYGAWGADLAAVYMAGWLIDHGQSALVYATDAGLFGSTPPEWIPALEAMGIDATSPTRELAFPYVYPPLWAQMVAPLTRHLTLQEFMNAVCIVHTMLLGGSVILAALVTQTRTLPWYRIAIFLVITGVIAVPFKIALLFNQPSVIMIALTLLSLERLQAGKSYQAGIALALATALKLTPAAFVLVFLLDRNWRALASFGIVCAAFAMANWIITPALTAEYVTMIPYISAHTTIAPVNVSLLPALYAIGEWMGYFAPFPIGANAELLGPDMGKPIPTLLRMIPKGAAAVALMAALMALAPVLPPKAQGEALQLRRVGMALMISMIVPLFGPLGWLHYYILPLLLLPILASALKWRPTLALWCGVLALNSMSFGGWIKNILGDTSQLVVFSTAIWALTFLIALGLLARRARTVAAHADPSASPAPSLPIIAMQRGHDQ